MPYEVDNAHIYAVFIDELTSRLLILAFDQSLFQNHET